MKFIKKRKEAAKKELAFEKDNLWYFIPLYIRIAILMFLVFVATFYGTSYNMCEDMGGYLTGSSMILPKCEPIPEKFYKNDTFYINLDFLYKKQKIINIS